MSVLQGRVQITWWLANSDLLLSECPPVSCKVSQVPQFRVPEGLLLTQGLCKVGPGRPWACGQGLEVLTGLWGFLSLFVHRIDV